MIKENFYYCPQCNSQLPTLKCPKCKLQISTELDKFLTLKEMKDIMRKMLKENDDWNCDMLVERIFEAQNQRNKLI